MPDDLKLKIEQFLIEAADCDLIGSLAADESTRKTSRLRATELRRLAEEVRAEMIGVETSDAEFLISHARECRQLAATVTDQQIRDELFALAADMELRASQEKDGKADS